MRRWSWMAALCLAGSVAAEELAVDTVFFDGWESFQGDLLRINLLALRDPHLYVDTGFPFGCLDITDQGDPLGLAPGFNPALNQSLNNDGSGDGFLDASPLLLIEPFAAGASPGRVWLADGRCSAPAATTSCEILTAGLPQPYESAPLDGLCRGPLPDTTSGYQPPVLAVEDPCFASAPADGVLELQGIALELVDSSLAGSWVDAADGLVTAGLLRGFLSEEDADAIVLPEELDFVGGQPLSVLLPGGAGNCAPGDDRDVHQGVTGWWFYLEFDALRPDA